MFFHVATNISQSVVLNGNSKSPTSHKKPKRAKNKKRVKKDGRVSNQASQSKRHLYKALQVQVAAHGMFMTMRKHLNLSAIHNVASSRGCACQCTEPQPALNTQSLWNTHSPEISLFVYRLLAFGRLALDPLGLSPNGPMSEAPGGPSLSRPRCIPLI